MYRETVNQLVQSILNTDAEAFMIFVNISGRNSGNTIEDASEPHVNTAETLDKMTWKNTIEPDLKAVER